MKYLAQQASDLVAYLLLPLFALLVPARWSRSAIARLSRWNWLLAPLCQQVYAQASAHTHISDPGQWRARWRAVELMDVRDTFLLAFGRERSVFSELSGLEKLDVARGTVMVGMHWGPQISIVRLLARQGMQPALIHRGVERSKFWRRPFQYAYLHLALREVIRACDGRAIAVRGAMDKLRQRLSEGGTEIVVLDAPPMSGRSLLHGQVLGRAAVFNAGFPQVLAESGKPAVFFAIGLHPDGSLNKMLYLEPLGTSTSAERFFAAYCDFLDRHLHLDSAHWRLWQVAGQFFPEADAG